MMESDYFILFYAMMLVVCYAIISIKACFPWIFILSLSLESTKIFYPGYLNEPAHIYVVSCSNRILRDRPYQLLA